MAVERPKALNENGYTYMFEGEYPSHGAAQYRLKVLLRDELPDDAKYRIIQKGDWKYELYIW